MKLEVGLTALREEGWQSLQLWLQATGSCYIVSVTSLLRALSPRAPMLHTHASCLWVPLSRKLRLVFLNILPQLYSSTVVLPSGTNSSKPEPRPDQNGVALDTASKLEPCLVSHEVKPPWKPNEVLGDGNSRLVLNDVNLLRFFNPVF